MSTGFIRVLSTLMLTAALSATLQHDALKIEAMQATAAMRRAASPPPQSVSAASPRLEGKEQVSPQVDQLGQAAALQAHVEELDQRIGDVNLHITAFGILVAIIGSLIAGVALFTARENARKAADEMFKKWCEDQEAKFTALLAKTVADGTAKIDAVVADGAKKIDAKVEEAEKAVAAAAEATAAAQTATAGANEAIAAAQEMLILRQKSPGLTEEQVSKLRETDQALRDKPQSSYTASEWEEKAFAAYVEHKPEIALEYFLEAAKAANATPEEVAKALANAASLHLSLGRYDQSLAISKQLLEQFRESTDPGVTFQVAWTLLTKGGAEMLTSQYADAAATYLEMLDRFQNDERAEIQELVMRAMENTIEPLARTNRTTDAIKMSNSLSKRFGDRDDPKGLTALADAALSRAIVLKMINQHDEALKTLRELVARYELLAADRKSLRAVVTKAKEYLAAPDSAWDFVWYEDDD